jgi:hypothetical protein
MRDPGRVLGADEFLPLFAQTGQQPEGAAIGDLTAATGWQVHSVRAALIGLAAVGVRQRRLALLRHK